ncbi:LOW QUALITY PROTEIN: hypothetical protein DAPPUDRAFT_255985 [Daphnia pulex]|uniref:Uncharacterized protein n=1 Tax=Daphnia pulex TaxID=6669 RepID=E9HAG0_DAPPU|nr:LOW QUALITY PROTEIN: hypothetical protein DAPPUDRAFT_255985 [Daphnia pulex]|eukprot:EFX71301.1 LOW QUALITY PROTEIN: hypothetical protein DAPPUDRAFT_255985 [Daphnia pulex]
MSTYATPTYYTDARKYCTTKAPRLHENLRFPELLHGSISLPRLHTEAAACYTTQAVEYYTGASKYYTETYCRAQFVTNCLLHRIDPQTATPLPYYTTTTTYATVGYYTTKSSEYYTETYDAPSYYTDLRTSALSYITKEPEYYPKAPKYYPAVLLCV